MMRECGNDNRSQKISNIMERLTPQTIDFVMAMLDRPSEEWEQMATEYRARASR